MAKKYEVFKNAVIAQNTAIEKIIPLDLEHHRMMIDNGTTDNGFVFVVQYNKSEATSNITITYEASFDGIQFIAAAGTLVAAFAGASGGASDYQDVTGVTAVNGWDKGYILYMPAYIKIIVTENNAGAISDLDLVLVAP